MREILVRMPPVTNRVEVLSHYGSNSDIQKALEESLQEAVDQTKKIAKDFQGENAKETGKKIWQFLKDKIKYQADGFEVQKIKFPNQLLSSGVGDCKSFTLFAAAILVNLGYSVRLIYASYKADSKTPTHVYCDFSEPVYLGQKPKWA